MTRDQSVLVPEFRRKLDLMRTLLDLRTDAAFAALLGLTPPALVRYLKERNPRIPRKHIEKMAELLSSALGRVTQEQVVEALGASYDYFEVAVTSRTSNAFERLYFSTSSQLKTQLVLMSNGLQAIDDDVVLAPPDAMRAPAESQFQLVAHGTSGHFAVALVHSTIGWQIAAPRKSEPIRIPEHGSLRAPENPLRFSKDGGLHRFCILTIDAPSPPRLISRQSFAAPLSHHELDLFASDLTDPLRTRAWKLGRFAVLVERA